VFAGQALPLAVRHDLSVAPGTALSATSPVSGGRAGTAGGALRTAITRALGEVPFGFWSAWWSDPLGLVPGSLPARPASAGQGNVPLLEAAAMDGVTTHAVLVSGKWPGAPTPASSKRGIPAALPVTAATLLHLEPGDVLTLRDRITGARDNFRITGLFAPRRLTGTAASYWRLNSIPASGSATIGGFTTYGPLLVSPAAFATAKLATSTATWLAQPDMGKFTDTDLSAVSGDVAALQGELQNSKHAERRAAVHQPAVGPERRGQQPVRGAVAAGDQRPAASGARLRRAARHLTAAGHPARGGNGLADLARRVALAADPAHRE
jgi:hypothetical protein